MIPGDILQVASKPPANLEAPACKFGRWPAGSVPDGFWPFASDLAVEVVSLSNSAADMQEKVLQYLAAGTSVVWVVQSRTRTVEVWRPGLDIQVLREDDRLEGPGVLPGFGVLVRELFAV